MEPTDLGFVYSTWLKGLRYGNAWFEQIEQSIYFAEYHRVIESILARPTVKPQIACLRDEPDLILGYAVYEPQTLHWVHVKQAWRNIGLARDLIPKDIKTVTHINGVGMAIKPAHVIFNPFIGT